jgi:hypothetical protein
MGRIFQGCESDLPVKLKLTVLDPSCCDQVIPFEMFDQTDRATHVLPGFI